MGKFADVAEVANKLGAAFESEMDGSFTRIRVVLPPERVWSWHGRGVLELEVFDSEEIEYEALLHQMQCGARAA